jgi:hypothetical protein
MSPMPFSLAHLIAHVENPLVIAASTQTPCGGREHAVGAHVAEGHGSWVAPGLQRGVIYVHAV